MQFSCNQCGERTERLINRLAYERGLVYVQVSTFLTVIDGIVVRCFLMRVKLLNIYSDILQISFILILPW